MNSLNQTIFSALKLGLGLAFGLGLGLASEARAAVYYVDNKVTNASDNNSGSATSPWRTIQRGANSLRPGDTLYVRAGNYAPFVVNTEGSATAGDIVISAAPGDERKVLISGTGYTGPRGIINIKGKSHVQILGFHLRNAKTDGIYVEGSISGERGIRIANNKVEITGNSGIYAAGLVMGQTIGVNEYRLFDLLIENNDVSRTNEPDGGNEAITVGGGLNGFVIRNNVVHDSQQYGIDCKLGCINGKIYGNHIYNIEKHGIYLDSASRTLANIEVYNNKIHNCTNGITLARESNREPKVPVVRDVLIYNNLVHDNKKYGIMVYKHIWDTGTGDLKDVTITSNTIYRNALDGIGKFQDRCRI